MLYKSERLFQDITAFLAEGMRWLPHWGCQTLYEQRPRQNPR